MIMIKIQGSDTALLLLVNHIKTMALRAPVISIIFWKEDASLLEMFNPLYSNTNQQLFWKEL